MAKHITRWRPDTCRCVLELEWDDQDPPENRVHTPVKVERCGAHTNEAPELQVVFDVVQSENVAKNLVLHHLLETLGEEHIDLIGEVRQFKHAPAFTYTVDRELQVAFPADTPEATLIASREALISRAFGRAVEVI